jgi:hypothetical protein
MGLDMYLTAFEFAETDDSYMYVESKEHSLYWRKANHIHGWFVRNVQNDQDDCEYYVVSLEKLKELHSICIQLLSKYKSNEITDDLRELAMQMLPPTEGFFFGDTAIDEFYISDLQNTLVKLGKLIDGYGKNIVFAIYHSSW